MRRRGGANCRPLVHKTATKSGTSRWEGRTPYPEGETLTE
jgi:hypothetical protein